jgi:MFS family permease
MLVAARLIQGLVSGPMMSVAQAILLRNYPIERRGTAIALWAMVIVIAPIFGPIIGGMDHGQFILAVDFLYQSAGGRLLGGGQLDAVAAP